MKVISALLLGALAIAGCAAPRTLYVPGTASFSVPAIGQIARVSPGDPMLAQGRNRIYESLNVQQPLACPPADTSKKANRNKLSSSHGMK
jgi:hypothetical protein